MRFEITQVDTWAVFQKAAGRTVYEHTLESGEKALFIKFKLPLGKAWLLGMGVDFEKFSEKDWDGLFEWAKKNGCTHIRCEGFLGNLSGRGSLKEIEKSYLPQWTIKVDLSGSEEDILAQMKRKGRYNIKVAGKSGVAVESYMGSDVSSVVMDEFYSVLSETGGRDGFGIHPKSYYEKMLKSLGENVGLYVGRLEGKVIAGIIVVYGKDEAVYYYGASSNTHRNVMAPYLLQWKAMQDAKEAGKHWYDFMGVAHPMGEVADGSIAREVEFDKSDHLYGVTEFKQKFGGKVFSFQKPVDLVLSSFWYGVVKIVKKLRG